MQDLIYSTNHGTILTEKGKILSLALVQSIPAETDMPQCSIALGKFNCAVLLKQSRFAIKSGIEQRDAAIKVGALGATTLFTKIINLLYREYFLLSILSMIPCKNTNQMSRNFRLLYSGLKTMMSLL
jgi:hypothetical protein